MTRSWGSQARCSHLAALLSRSFTPAAGQDRARERKAALERMSSESCRVLLQLWKLPQQIASSD